MNYNIQNVHIAILGPASINNSTLLNALCGYILSEMEQTNMFPQIYTTESDKKNNKNIFKENKNMNKKLWDLYINNNLTSGDIIENLYDVSQISDFLEPIYKNQKYSILNMPGLNDNNNMELYYEYIEKKSYDIYILIFNLKKLDTSDETILTFVLNQIKNSKGFVHILIDKCEDVHFKKNSFKFADTNKQEIYDQMKNNILKIFGENCIYLSISPIRIDLLCAYRVGKENFTNLHKRYYDLIAKNEGEINRMPKPVKKKKDFIKNLIKTGYDSAMIKTGYRLFLNNIGKVMKNYKDMVLYHLKSVNGKFLADSDGDKYETLNELIDWIDEPLILIQNMLEIPNIKYDEEINESFMMLRHRLTFCPKKINTEREAYNSSKKKN